MVEAVDSIKVFLFTLLLKNINKSIFCISKGPPERVIPFGYFDFTCEDDLVLKSEIEDVPYFNAPIFLENKSQIGKIDEIFGTLRDYSVSVKLSDNMRVSFT